MSCVTGPLTRNGVTMQPSGGNSAGVWSPSDRKQELACHLKSFKSANGKSAVYWKYKTLPLPSDMSQICELKKSHAF